MNTTRMIVSRIRNHLTLPVLCSLGVFIVFLLLRGYSALQALPGAGPIVDTQVFMEMSRAPVVSKTMFGGLRPPVVPLLYKMLGGNIGPIIIIQTLISLCSWVFVACTLLPWLRSTAGKIVAFWLVVLVGTSEPVVVWESCLISESVSVSLLVTVIGCWLLFLKQETWPRFWLLLSASVLWMFCRETNSWMQLFAALGIFPVALVKKNRRYITFVALSFVAFGVSNWSSAQGKRWTFPLLNVVSTRILPDSSHTAFFEQRGMPVTSALREMTNSCASCKDYAYYNKPELEAFRTWFFRYGKKTYIQWLMAHPASTLREPLSNIEYMLAPGSQFHYASPSSIRILPPMASKLLFPIGYQRYFSLLMVWGLLFCIGIVTGRGKWIHNSIWRVPVILVLLAYPHLIVVWHGDILGFEMGRHALSIRMQLNVALWILVCLVLDNTLEYIRRCGGFRELAAKNVNRWLR